MGFYLAERFTPSGLLQAQGGGYDNGLTQQQLTHYEPQVQYPISGTQISRKWEYDAAFNLTASNDRAWGRTEYQSNRNGQVTAVLNTQLEESCRYDSQQNLTLHTQTTAIQQKQWLFEQHHGRTIRRGNATYSYDKLGRLTEKAEQKDGFRPMLTKYIWNSQNQLVEVRTLTNGIWRYEYDSFGRRTEKYQISRAKLVHGIPTTHHKLLFENC